MHGSFEMVNVDIENVQLNSIGLVNGGVFGLVNITPLDRKLRGVEKSSETIIKLIQGSLYQGALPF